MANKPTKQDKAMLKESERYLPTDPNKKGKLDIDEAYHERVGKLVDKLSDKEMKKMMKLKTNKEVSKEVMKRTQGMSTGGLSSKKYVNPVTIVDHLKKK